MRCCSPWSSGASTATWAVTSCARPCRSQSRKVLQGFREFQGAQDFATFFLLRFSFCSEVPLMSIVQNAGKEGKAPCVRSCYGLRVYVCVYKYICRYKDMCAYSCVRASSFSGLLELHSTFL